MWLFDFQITEASIVLTCRVNKYRIQFPWSHAISWQSSRRSNRLLWGTWAAVKKKSWVYERCWHLEQATKRGKCQILRNNYGVIPWFKASTSPSFILCTVELLRQHLTVFVSLGRRILLRAAVLTANIWIAFPPFHSPLICCAQKVTFTFAHLNKS